MNKADLGLYTGFISGRGSEFCARQRVQTAVWLSQCAVRCVVGISLAGQWRKREQAELQNVRTDKCTPWEGASLQTSLLT
jgi:hypothetical protein